ncbi:hypothetical protein Landi51_13307 [Colletotrichum acutatum]
MRFSIVTFLTAVMAVTTAASSVEAEKRQLSAVNLISAFSNAWMILAFTTDMPFPSAGEPAVNALENKLPFSFGAATTTFWPLTPSPCTAPSPLDSWGRAQFRDYREAIIRSNQVSEQPLDGLLTTRRFQSLECLQRIP